MKEFKQYIDKLYQVSSDGKVFSIRTNKHLKPQISGRGYLDVTFHCNGIKIVNRVHRIVAELFIPNPNNYHDVNHKDGNKFNNQASNLEWCSRTQNLQHAYDTGLRRKKISDNDKSEMIEANLAGISQADIARHYNVSNAIICRIMNKYKTDCK